MTREEACVKIHETIKAELGVSEIPGKESNPRIDVYASFTTLKATSDEISWCSSLVNAVVYWSGFKPTRSAAARSWLDWGVPLEVPIVGCIVVFERKDVNNPNAAHVAVCDHADISNGIVRVIGGNQKNCVCVAPYPVEKVLGYRSPL